MLLENEILTIFKNLCKEHLDRDSGYFVVLFPYTRPDMTPEERNTGQYHCISSVSDVRIAEVLERCARAIRAAAAGTVDGALHGEKYKLEQDPEPEIN